MSFRFDFPIATDTSSSSQSPPSSTRENSNTSQLPTKRSNQTNKVTLIDITSESEKIKTTSASLSYSIVKSLPKGTTPPLYKIDHVPLDDVPTDESIPKNSDISPGVYEGGLKVWECSLDLCRYILSPRRSSHGLLSKALSSDGTTLELGCGQGLPGCLILREGRGKVVFTDYNDFVLRLVTLPNILRNLTSPENNESEKLLSSRVGMIAGDWMEVSKSIINDRLGNDVVTTILLPIDGRFDLILAAETTYTVASTADTATWMGRHLKVGSGVGIVAMKRYYFGVGGGVDEFRKECERQVVEEGGKEYRLVVETLDEFDSGLGNIRELLAVRCITK